MPACKKCGKILSSENWFPSWQHGQGLKYLCKTCHAERVRKTYDSKVWALYRKRYYSKHKEQILSKKKERNQELRLEVLIHYSNNPPSCACCGERNLEFLQIDHVNGGGTKHLRSLQKHGIGFYKWLKDQNFPLRYRVLCANCNFSCGIYGYCPHAK